MKKFRRKWENKSLLSDTTVTLNESQGHSNWYQNKFSDLYDHIGLKKKKKKKKSVTVRKQDKHSGVFSLQSPLGKVPSLEHQSDKVKYATTGLNRTQHSILTNQNNLRYFAQLLAYCTLVTLTQVQRCQPLSLTKLTIFKI